LYFVGPSTLCTVLIGDHLEQRLQVKLRRHPALRRWIPALAADGQGPHVNVGVEASSQLA
jgi:hypothetical protein